jgi:hypothetical protein
MQVGQGRAWQSKAGRHAGRPGREAGKQDKGGRKARQASLGTQGKADMQAG